MASLTRAVCVVQSAVRYALAATELTTPELLDGPTPCAAWDLGLLLAHVADSMDVLSEAIAAGHLMLSPGTSHDPGVIDPVVLLRRRASGLLTACADAGASDRVVLIGDQGLPASVTALAGALEITVHGWDIASACGSRQPVPPHLGAILLPVAPLLITPATRPGLFADPVAVAAGRYDPGDQLIAFTGRRPRPETPSTGK